MEAIAAFALAANICQFIDYGFDIVNAAKELSESGQPSVDPDLERNTQQMRTLSFKLSAENQPAGHSPDVEQLHMIARECSALSTELLATLEASNVKRPNSTLHSVLAVLKFKSRKAQQDSLEKKLDRCRSQLQTQITAMMRSEMHEKIGQLLNSDQEVRNDLSGLQTNIEALRSTLGSGHMTNDILEQFRTVLKAYTDATSRIELDTMLRSIYIPPINQRFDMVGAAHESTFNWIFDTPDDKEHEPKSNQRPLSWMLNDEATRHLRELAKERRTSAKQSFINWLESGQGIFFISGKPGAGKSTLMKYLCCHNRLKDHLSTWAGKDQLIVAKYFFWRPDPKQSSWRDLLRGILAQVLTQSPDLLTRAFPSMLRKNQQHPEVPFKFNEQDHKQGLENLFGAKQSIPGKRFVFFIDGLDEYRGNHKEMTDTLIGWTQGSPDTLKLCVSGRESNIFHTAFHGFPQFKIHELTDVDIRRLVSSRICSTQWESIGEVGVENITGLILRKAEGVFLWVSLVLNTVEEGLINGDGILELEKKIDTCPTELEELFGFLLNAIHKCDRKWAAAAVAMVQAQQVLHDPILGIYAFSFLDNYCLDNNFSIEELRTDWDSSTIERRIEKARRQVIGRCKGLLDICTAPNSRSGSDIVLFTHRSIFEFMETAHVQSQMRDYIGSFDPLDAICRTHLAQVKTYYPWECTLKRKGHESLPEVPFAMTFQLHDFFILAMLLGKADSLQWFQFLDSMGQLFSNLLTGNEKFIISEAALPFEASHYIKFLAIANGAHEYLQWALGSNADEFFRQKNHLQIAHLKIRNLVSYNIWRGYMYALPPQRIITTLDYCFGHGASPNFRVPPEAFSFWHEALWTCISDGLNADQSITALMEVFLFYGASPDFTISFSDDANNDSYIRITSTGDGFPIKSHFERPVFSYDYEVSEEASSHTVYRTSELVKRTRIRDKVKLHDLVELWVPKDAARLQKLMDEPPLTDASGIMYRKDDGLKLNANENAKHTTTMRSFPDL